MIEYRVRNRLDPRLLVFYNRAAFRATASFARHAGPGKTRKNNVKRFQRDQILDENKMFSQLEELIQGLDIKIRYEPIRKEASYSGGGLCRFKGDWVLIINSKAPIGEKIEIMAGAVNRFDLSGVYLKPGLREFLERFPRQETLLRDE